MVTAIDRAAFERIDSFPFRHRVGELMSSPPVTAPPGMALAAAARLMRERGVGSLFVLDEAGRPVGIVTERDLLNALAEAGAAAAEARLADHMSGPVRSVGPDDHLFLAMGRMQRLGFRHLAVVEPQSQRLVGVISARTVLRQRGGPALALGDEIATAADGAELGAIRARLPQIARGLLAEQVPALDIAGVVSAVLREVSARAAELAAQTLAAGAAGPAPAPWCFLVLGSGGRGESLLAADQDNALVHAGDAGDDGWFAELGRLAAATLDEAGIPYCRGGVMAKNAAWRHDLEGWRRQVERWVARPEPENLLNVDIFYDFQPVFGERGLGEALRAHATAAAAAAPPFLALLAVQLRQARAPLGLFGGFRTEAGRIDLKRGGLLPLTAAARVLALKRGVGATATAARLEAAVQAGWIGAEDAAAFREAQALLTGLVLEQQILDIEAGRPPSTKVEAKRLSRRTRRRLREALKLVDLLDQMVQDALAAG